ncbi:MAG: Tim44 domain-containing protein [Proteobacteria bacterium]|nr:MAG: Tim44 domain-containing protein [Pseudomonadota bacterium]
MFRMRIASLVRAFLLILFASVAIELAMPLDADARAGGRRSVGRSSSRPAPAQQYRPQSAPPPSSAQPPRGGGFMRGLAGGVAGGFLGSMLFSSMGHAAGGAGGMGGGSGGIGLIEIILIAGLAYLAFRWWKSRQMKTAGQVAGSGFGSNYSPQTQSSALNQDPMAYSANSAQEQNTFVSSGSSIEADEASDIFFKVQGAFTRRDLSSVGEILGQDVYQALNQDVRDLKDKKQINRLENISVRKVDVLDRWNEQGAEFAKVRFTANLLDYTVDETSNSIISGSASDPVKFEEDWIFCRQTAYAAWQLVGIQQV